MPWARRVRSGGSETILLTDINDTSKSTVLALKCDVTANKTPETCALCCETMDEQSAMRCKVFLPGAPMSTSCGHAFCWSCLCKETRRVAAVDVDFDSLKLRDAHVLCPFVQDLSAWRVLADAHEEGKLVDLLDGIPPVEASDEVSTLFESFAAMEFTMRSALVKDAVAACGCASAPFTDRQLAMACDDASFDMYSRARARVRDDAIFSAAQEEVVETVMGLRAAFDQKRDFNVRHGLLAKQLKNQMPRARQCGRCFFGPVDHFACGDLQAHHNQGIGRAGARVNNSCPKCGWFSAELRDWPEWDGELTPCLDDLVDFSSAPRREFKDAATATEVMPALTAFARWTIPRRARSA